MHSVLQYSSVLSRPPSFGGGNYECWGGVDDRAPKARGRVAVVGYISNELTIVTMNDKCYRNYVISETDAS